MSTTHPSYPVHIQAQLDPGLSRWLWLVKWLLVIPHYIVLAFLWAAFVVLSVVAFFAILFGGTYPRTLFEFNVGVLRWSWRVAYYAYGALGTDRYPPFTLADDPDYPARIDVAYPEHLSRGLVLVKWWLLAIPHYLIVAIFVGGGAWIGWRSEDWQWSWGGGGLVGLLVLISAVILAFTGSYPRSLFDVILGMNRWALRVAGYAGLMTDQYPPFRLDLGGDDPDGEITLRSAGGPGSGAVVEPGSSRVVEPGVGTTPSSVAKPAWTPGRVISVILGPLLALTSAGLIAGGAGLLWASGTQRDADGFLTSNTVRLSTGGYAVASDNVALEGAGPSWAYPDAVIGSVRVRAESATAGQDIFIGVGRTADVERYLSTVQYATISRIAIGTGQQITYTDHSGGAPGSAPARAGIWMEQASGPGRQALIWSPEAGDWTFVVMNADASSAVVADADMAGDIPALPWLGAGLLALGLVMLAAGALLIGIGAGRAVAAARTATPTTYPADTTVGPDDPPGTG